MKAIAAALITGMALIAAPSAAPSGPLEGHSRTTHWFVLGAGKATKTFATRRPSGVVLLTRLTVLHGVRAWVRATIPSLAGVGVSTTTAECRRRGRFDVCNQSQEWCPMPRTTWRVRVVKSGGPAGLVRFDFVVGKPPR